MAKKRGTRLLMERRSQRGERVDYDDPALAYEGLVVVYAVGARRSPWHRMFPVWRQPATINHWCRYCTRGRWSTRVITPAPKWSRTPERHHHFRFELVEDAALWSVFAGVVPRPREDLK